MNITTVGNALNFAKELEAKEMKLGEEGAAFFSDEDMKNLCLRLTEGCEKRITLLGKIYDDFTFSDMDVGILAPIEAIDGSHYILQENLIFDKDTKTVFEKWYNILQKTDQFYADFSDQLLSGPRSLHRRIGKMMNKRSETASIFDYVINKQI